MSDTRGRYEEIPHSNDAPSRDSFDGPAWRKWALHLGTIVVLSLAGLALWGGARFYFGVRDDQ